MYSYYLEPMYKFIGNNEKRMKEFYDMYNKATDRDMKTHVDYFRELQHESSFLLYQRLLEESRTAYIQASSHERNEKRQDHRNGYKINKTTRIPGSEHLVTFTPQVRNFPDRFKKYLVMKDLPNEFEDFIVDLITHGRSSNDIKTLIAKQMNISISKTKILSVLNKYEDEYKKWAMRPLKDDYPFIFIDGKWAKVRKNGEISKMVFITVLGMNRNGEKEVLGFRLADSENEDDVFALCKNIYMRGVKNVKLVTADGASVMRKVASAVWPTAKFQLCTVHKMRNIVSNCSNKRRVKYILNSAKNIFACHSFCEASRPIEEFIEKWKTKEPKAVRCFLNKIELCFKYREVTDDPKMLKKLHSTNPIERYFRETKRRLRELGYLRSASRATLWYYQIVKEVSKKSKNTAWAL